MVLHEIFIQKDTFGGRFYEFFFWIHSEIFKIILKSCSRAPIIFDSVSGARTDLNRMNFVLTFGGCKFRIKSLAHFCINERLSSKVGFGPLVFLLAWVGSGSHFLEKSSKCSEWVMTRWGDMNGNSWVLGCLESNEGFRGSMSFNQWTLPSLKKMARLRNNLIMSAKNYYKIRGVRTNNFEIFYLC